MNSGCGIGRELTGFDPFLLNNGVCCFGLRIGLGE